MISECQIKKISEIDKSKLEVFYKKNFPFRYKTLTDNWQWWYNCKNINQHPIVLLHRDDVIGQAAHTPVSLKFNGKKINAFWFQDFVIDEKFSRRGLGKFLCLEWMKLTKNCITICSPLSLKLFTKVGWLSNKQTQRLVQPVNISNFLSNQFKLNIKLFDNLYKNFVKKGFKFNKEIKSFRVDKNFKLFYEAFKNIENNNNSPDKLFIDKDESWFNWRLLDCPYKKDLYFLNSDDLFALVHIYNYKNKKRLNILFAFSTQGPREKELFEMIFLWSIDNKIDLIWSTSNNPFIKKNFPNLLKKNMNFASFSFDKEIHNILSQKTLEFNSIDSDIESSLFIES